MYARVAKWEGVDPERMRAFADEVNGSDGPREGVPSSGIMLLNDPASGRSVVIALFDSEEDMRKGDETLNAMSPSDDEAEGKRTTVELYEVAADRRL